MLKEVKNSFSGIVIGQFEISARADLRGADLREANLRGADLRWADLREADLRGADLREANLRGADLRGADLRGADLHEANLREANLRGADLRWANLREANLREANLRGADLDFSCLPLWCGGTHFKIDLKIAAQIALHFVSIECEDEEVKAAQQALFPLAKQSHRWNDVMEDEG